MSEAVATRPSKKHAKVYGPELVEDVVCSVLEIKMP
jgi:hypothetical protein